MTMPYVAAETSVISQSPERCGGQSVGLTTSSSGLSCRCTSLRRVARLRSPACQLLTLQNIKELLDDKKKAFIEWQNGISSTSKRDSFKHLQRQAQTALRKMQDEWWKKKADEIETYAATKNSKMFFSAIKEVYGPTKPRTTSLLSADCSTLLQKKSSINARWTPLWTPLCSTRSQQKPVITSLDLSL